MNKLGVLQSLIGTSYCDHNLTLPLVHNSSKRHPNLVARGELYCMGPLSGRMSALWGISRAVR